LQSEDDWSFVIKLHAVFEALATHLLSYYFQEEPLHQLLARLELSNKTTGKVALPGHSGSFGLLNNALSLMLPCPNCGKLKALRLPGSRFEAVSSEGRSPAS
jgi:hypothetical protein